MNNHLNNTSQWLRPFFHSCAIAPAVRDLLRWRFSNNATITNFIKHWLSISLKSVICNLLSRTIWAGGCNPQLPEDQSCKHQSCLSYNPLNRVQTFFHGMTKTVMPWNIFLSLNRIHPNLQFIKPNWLRYKGRLARPTALNISSSLMINQIIN